MTSYTGQILTKVKTSACCIPEFFMVDVTMTPLKGYTHSKDWI